MMRSISSFTVGMSWTSPATMPQDQPPASKSPSCITLGYTPTNSSAMSLNSSLGPRALSFSNNFSTAALFKTLSVLRNGRIIKRVSSSLAATKACLTFSCTGASWVAMKRVPIFIPSAPIASDATNERASAMPPDETKGISSSSAALGSKIKFGTSSSPGWPPHSKPSTETASQPIVCALSAWRTEVHL